MGFMERCRGAVPAVIVAATLTHSANALVEDLADGLEVVHASVVFRHGQRSRLVKTLASEFGVNAGVSLTPTGESEAFELGQNLRERYISSAVDVSATTPIDGMTLYDSARVQVVSSGYDRTLESAAAMALGLYPTGTEDEVEQNTTLLPHHQIIVPIHSSDPENDAVILASDLCPVYTDNWHEFYRTTQFQDKQNEALDFIEKLYFEFDQIRNTNDPPCWEEVERLNEFKLEFHAPYNLWDCAVGLINVGEYQAQSLIDIAQPPSTQLAEKGWEYLEDLVFWIEDQKYQQTITGRMLGGLYVTHMMIRFEEVIEHIHNRADTVGRFTGMHITAGHYPTLKGIAAALDTGGIDGIPATTSHLAFELIYDNKASSGEEFSVRILYQDGTNVSTLRVLQLGEIFDADDDALQLDSNVDYNSRDADNMPWSVWTYLMGYMVDGGPVYYPDGEEQWCEDCRTQSVDTCTTLALEEMTNNWETAVGNTQDAVEEKNAVDDGIEGYHVALLGIFGLVIGVVVGFCARPCVERRNQKRRDNLAISGDDGLEGWGNRPSTNGVFRLGSAKTRTPARHVMLGGQRAMGVHTAVETDDSLEMEEGAGEAEMGEPSRIPAFASTTSLGEPVPFPNSRGPSSGKIVKVAPLSPAGEAAESNGGYVVSPVPASNGNGNMYSEKVMGAGGGSWDANGVQEDWGNVNDEDNEHYEGRNGAPYN